MALVFKDEGMTDREARRLARERRMDVACEKSKEACRELRAACEQSNAVYDQLCRKDEQAAAEGGEA